MSYFHPDYHNQISMMKTAYLIEASFSLATEAFS